jgi:Domain of unknown function (DUF3859)
MQRFVSILIATLALCGQASAQQVTGATITWYGNFIAARTKYVPDETVPTGERGTQSDVTAPAANADRITATEGSTFGFGYCLVGSPTDAVVTVRHVYKIPPPGIADRKTGKMVLTFGPTIQRRLNRYYLIGHGLSQMSTFPIGVWTLQVWYGDRLLAEKAFNVVRQDPGVQKPPVGVPSAAAATSPPSTTQTCAPLVSMLLETAN